MGMVGRAMLNYILSEKELRAALAGRAGAETVRALIYGFDAVLLAEARRAAIRSRRGARAGRDDLEGSGAYCAILTAAAACETWLSEYITLAELGFVQTLEELVKLRDERNALSQWKKAMKLRTPEFDSGSSNEFRRLGCLFKLRDIAAHRNARILPLGTWPESIRSCVENGTIPVREVAASDWTSVAYVHEVAAWAASSARDWLVLVESHLGRLPRVNG